MSTSRKAPRRPVLLLILDGFGVNPARANNAVQIAETPRFDHYFSHYPHTLLEASGAAVGLPAGQMGNSEVGHITLGCGSILRQDLVRIDDAIADGSLFANPALCAAVEHSAAIRRPLHLIGLVSDGGVHSHLRHIEALIELCKRHSVQPMLHMITDGRDTAPRCARQYLVGLEARLADAGGRIASVCGRYWAMDRDKRWDRSERAWRALVRGEGQTAATASEAIAQAYAADQGDEFIEPTVLAGGQTIAADDRVVFFNFRNDRPRQMTEALASADFSGFDRGDFQPVQVTTMTEYDSSYPCPVAFAPEQPEITLGRILEQAGLAQFHCAETEKYAHVTFFFNGGRETPYPLEERVMVPSPRVATYDLKPEMSAAEVADALIEAMASGKYAFIVANFANGDMVGHTAVREAVIKAVEALDREVGRVLDAAVAQDYSVVLTADHGNCDEMVDPISGEPHTQHTTYPVPCLIIDAVPWRLWTGLGLSAIAPTVLQLLGLEQPAAMQGQSVLLESLEH